MTDTSEVIASLSAHITPAQTLSSPAYYAVRIVAVLVLYGIGCQLFLGVRADISLQLTRPLFLLEIVLLLLMLLSCVVASVLAMYPDAHQKSHLLKIPYGVCGVFITLIILQLIMPHDALMVMPTGDIHTMECALCIAAMSVIPSAILFALLRKGATLRPFQAGAYAMLAATSLSCLTIRIAEANDGIMHVLQWHYIPTLLFALLGTLAGKWLLKW